MDELKKDALALKDYIIKERRYFHSHPELGCHELGTTAHIKEALETIGVEVQTFSGMTGCVGIIRGKQSGKTVMLRADIDALPITEHANGRDYASQNPGVMHACGHDAHMAMLLGAARLLVERREEICGTVKLLFQMGEEIGTESRHYVEAGALDDVDAIFGQHIWALLPVGTANLEDGPRMASSDRFTITIHGKAAHGSAPQNGHDTIVAAAATVMGLQTLVSRVNDPKNTFVLTVGMMNGGTQSNIIADKTVLVGSTRALVNDFRKKIPGLIENLSKNLVKAYGCTADLTYFFGPDPLDNSHHELNEIGRAAYRYMLGGDALVPMRKQMGAEDFSVYMAKTAGVFGFLGTRNEAKGSVYPHHHPDFCVDEDSLPYGAGVYAYFALHYLAGK